DKIGARYVFLGGHRAFGEVCVTHKVYDYIGLMAPLSRRIYLYHALDDLGLTRADLPNGTWGDERHKRLQQSKLLLSCHQDEYQWSEPIRFMIASCYALPIVSETCANPGDYQKDVHYASAPFEDLPALARNL